MKFKVRKKGLKLINKSINILGVKKPQNLVNKGEEK